MYWKIKNWNIIKDKIKNNDFTLNFNIKRTYPDLLFRNPEEIAFNYSGIYSELYREK